MNIQDFFDKYSQAKDILVVSRADSAYLEQVAQDVRVVEIKVRCMNGTMVIPTREIEDRIETVRNGVIELKNG